MGEKSMKQDDSGHADLVLTPDGELLGCGAAILKSMGPVKYSPNGLPELLAISHSEQDFDELQKPAT